MPYVGNNAFVFTEANIEQWADLELYNTPSLSPVESSLLDFAA